MNILLVSPFKSDPNFEEKHSIISNICARCSISLLTAGKKYDNSFDTNVSVQVYHTCDVAIVDLTLERPSCYYELGYLEALNKKIFLISKEETVIHQTLNYEIIEKYEDLFSYRKLIEKIICQL